MGMIAQKILGEDIYQILKYGDLVLKLACEIESHISAGLSPAITSCFLWSNF